MAPSGPIRVDFLRPQDLPVGGRLGLSIAPGRWRPDGPANPLRADLRALRQVFGASALVTLMEEPELKQYGTSLSRLRSGARRAGLTSIWFPIPDFGVPSSEEETVRLVEGLVARLRSRETVVVHCLGGLGRSGTMASCVLVALGRNSADAIACVRAARPGAVQTPLQERFVESFEGAWLGRHGPRD